MIKKTKNVIILTIALILIIGVMAFVSKDEDPSTLSSAKYSSSTLTSSESDFDFKTISMKDGEVSHMFEFKNNGTEPVKIEKVYTSCLCTTAYITDSSGKKYGKFGMQGHGLPAKTNIEVAPGETALVEAIFDPNAHGPSGVGLAQRTLYFETNSAKSPRLELSFQAIVTR